MAQAASLSREHRVPPGLAGSGESATLQNVPEGCRDEAVLRSYPRAACTGDSWTLGQGSVGLVSAVPAHELLGAAGAVVGFLRPESVCVRLNTADMHMARPPCGQHKECGRAGSWAGMPLKVLSDSLGQVLTGWPVSSETRGWWWRFPALESLCLHVEPVCWGPGAVRLLSPTFQTP